MSFNQPVKTVHVTSPYGPRKAPALPGGGKGSSNHKGTDYRAATGVAILAIASGRVKFSGVNPARGQYITIDHGNGVESLSQHLSARSVKAGDTVTAGQQIGKSGATGSTAAGAHLHLELTINGTHTDPHAYIVAHSAQKAPAAPAAPTKPAKPSTPAPVRLGDRVLKRGDQGPDVVELQNILNAWYPAQRLRPALQPDGDYGERTEARVTYLQQRAGIDPDGVAGAQVFGVLGVKK